MKVLSFVFNFFIYLSLFSLHPSREREREREIFTILIIIYVIIYFSVETLFSTFVYFFNFLEENSQIDKKHGLPFRSVLAIASTSLLLPL